jgi:hypothetical protein
MYPKYNTFVRAHVHACAGRLFWSCRSVGDLNIYLPYKFEWIWTKNKKKKVSFCTFLCANFKRTCTCVHVFSEKNYYRSEHLLIVDYHPGKFHIDPLSSFWEHSPTHVNYQSPSIYHSKVIAKVKVFNKWVKHQGQKVTFLGTHRKVLSQETLVWNVKALVDIANVKVFNK